MPIMSAQKIDVLAVIGTAAKRLRLGVEGQRTADELGEVIAAVAELIEAAQDLDGVSDHDGRFPNCWQCRAVARLSAALARIGGAV